MTKGAGIYALPITVVKQIVDRSFPAISQDGWHRVILTNLPHPWTDAIAGGTESKIYQKRLRCWCNTNVGTKGWNSPRWDVWDFEHEGAAALFLLTWHNG